MPPKTPLEPVIHGRIDRDGYSVEKVFFKSHPGHYVTGNLYRPRAKDGKLREGKLPAVLCPHGHWANGRLYDAGDKEAKQQVAIKAEKTMDGGHSPLQARCAQLARMGCVVFFYDMVGYADSTTISHNAFGDAEAELRLQSLMGLQTWNSLRALDFLLGLPEIDPKRVGVTGASGGGTQTFILCAIDDRPAAAALFDRHRSLEARVGQAFARWPDSTVARLTQLAGLHPKSALVQLNLGIALFWAGENGSKEAWRSAAQLEPDTAYAVTAGNLLHPDFARNLPVFVPALDAPASIRSLSPPAQLRTLARLARAQDRNGTLLYGVALQRLGKQLSAERVFSSLARRRPDDPEAQVAAAVARFDKADPARAFSRLGPLSRRFPRAATVRFHLGLLLLWSGQVKEARRQLRLARAAQPGSPLARESKRYLDELTAAGI